MPFKFNVTIEPVQILNRIPDKIGDFRQAIAAFWNGSVLMLHNLINIPAYTAIQDEFFACQMDIHPNGFTIHTKFPPQYSEALCSISTPCAKRK